MEGVEKRQEHKPRLETAGTRSGRRGDDAVSELTSIRFAQIARRINQAAKDQSLCGPAFRSPPRAPGLRRSIRRRPDGSATVSVSLRGRPAVAVVADMIDGVMAANEHCSTRSAEVRDRLWSAAAPLLAAETDPGVNLAFAAANRRAA